jgi:hypothetical protein
MRTLGARRAPGLRILAGGAPLWPLGFGQLFRQHRGALLQDAADDGDAVGEIFR